jgi:predicted amino acid-binding ACT domain protein
MEFLSMKRKPASMAVSTSSLRTSTLDSFLPKKIRFDSSVTGENSFTGESSLFSKRNAAESFSQSLNKSTKLDVGAQYEQKLSEKQANILELQQKIIKTEMKLNNFVTAKDQLEHDLSNLKETCKTKVKHYEDKIDDLYVSLLKKFIDLFKLEITDFV